MGTVDHKFQPNLFVVFLKNYLLNSSISFRVFSLISFSIWRKSPREHDKNTMKEWIRTLSVAMKERADRRMNAPTYLVSGPHVVWRCIFGNFIQTLKIGFDITFLLLDQF